MGAGGRKLCTPFHQACHHRMLCHWHHWSDEIYWPVLKTTFIQLCQEIQKKIHITINFPSSTPINPFVPCWLVCCVCFSFHPDNMSFEDWVEMPSWLCCPRRLSKWLIVGFYGGTLGGLLQKCPSKDLAFGEKEVENTLGALDTRFGMARLEQLAPNSLSLYPPSKGTFLWERRVYPWIFVQLIRKASVCNERESGCQLT